MSQCELRALLKSQERLPIDFRTHRQLPKHRSMSNTETTPEQSVGPDQTLALKVQALRSKVEDLELQFQEAQTALTSSNEQLAKVSGECERVGDECERVNGEACGVSLLVDGLIGSGPSILRNIFDGFLKPQAKLLSMQTTAVAVVQSAPPLGSFTGEVPSTSASVSCRLRTSSGSRSMSLFTVSVSLCLLSHFVNNSYLN